MLDVVLNPFILMAILAAADMLFDFLKKEKYVSAIVTTIIATIFSWEIAVCMSIYVGIKLFKEKKRREQ